MSTNGNACFKAMILSHNSTTCNNYALSILSAFSPNSSIASTSNNTQIQQFITRTIQIAAEKRIELILERQIFELSMSTENKSAAQYAHSFEYEGIITIIPLEKPIIEQIINLPNKFPKSTLFLVIGLPSESLLDSEIVSLNQQLSEICQKNKQISQMVITKEQLKTSTQTNSKDISFKVNAPKIMLDLFYGSPRFQATINSSIPSNQSTSNTKKGVNSVEKPPKKLFSAKFFQKLFITALCYLLLSFLLPDLFQKQSKTSN